MSCRVPALVLITLLTVSACDIKKNEKDDYLISPVPFNKVVVNDEFWLPRIETNRTVTIPFALQKLSETGRMDNFLKASGRMEGPHIGKRYNDTDVFKVIEGIAYSLKTHPDAQLEAYTDSLIHEIALAQEPDGYLFTGRTIDPANPPAGSGTDRWKQLNSSHELYNSGHLYEAGIAYYQSTGKKELLDVCIRNADLLVKTFGHDKLHKIPGHQEVELALVKLYRITGNEDYLSLSRFFLDERGKDHYFEPFPDSSPFNIYNDDVYMQNHLPVIQQKEAVGHAVRAVYMYTGMADYAAISGDSSYTNAIQAIWDDVVNYKLYLTGGIGARHTTEAFGDKYELPNKEAYTETCASIGNVFWNYRLFLASGEVQYLDVLEKTLYNGLISGVSLSGDRFFYQNPLEAKGDYTRSEWFEVSCCPGNLVRFLPSLPGYLYAVGDKRLYVNLFVSSETEVEFNKIPVKVSMKSSLPWDGDATITVNPEKSAEFQVAIRIPGWSRGEAIPGTLYRFADNKTPVNTIQVNGEIAQVDHSESGYWMITREWNPGDQISIKLGMPIRLVEANPNLTEDVGKIALQRGPIIYCFESTDNPGVDFAKIKIDANSDLNYTFEPDMLTGVGTISVKGYCDDMNREEIVLKAIPYYAWSNRGLSEMKVWVDKL